MEELSKTQFILLVLLVSFVTSIGTGIITVSLLNVAPAEVTQTINRVVERTVEKVVPTEQGASVITKEITTVVKEEDLVIDAIDKNAKSVVRITYTLPSDFTDTIYGLGIVLTNDGLIVSSDNPVSRSARFSASLYDGSIVPLTVVSKNDGKQLAFFKAENNINKPVVFSPVIFEDKEMKLGQSVIALSGQERMSVANGRVAEIVRAKADTASSTAPIEFIKTDIVAKDNLSGGPLVNLSGLLVGIKAGPSSLWGDGFIPVNSIKSDKAALVK